MWIRRVNMQVGMWPSLTHSKRRKGGVCILYHDMHILHSAVGNTLLYFYIGNYIKIVCGKQKTKKITTIYIYMYI